MAALLEALGDKGRTVAGSVRIFAGGPVQPEIGFVLHSADYHRPDTVEIDGHVAMTSSREILRDIANQRGPKKSLIAFGYAGWAPGQLDAEMQANGWLSVSADSDLVFDSDFDAKWKRALAKLGIDLTLLSTEAGHA